MTAILVVLTAACGGDPQGSSPVPQPVPGLIRQSNPEPQTTQTLVVGLAKSVAGTGTVHLRDLTSGQQFTAPSTSAGSFVVVLPAADNLEAWFENADGSSEVVSLSMRSLGLRPQLGQSKTWGVISPPQGGEVVVTNDGGPGQPLLFDATPEVDVVVANGTNGAVKTTKTDTGGKLTVKISATSGDQIQIMLVDPNQTDLTSDFLTFVVP